MSRLLCLAVLLSALLAAPAHGDPLVRVLSEQADVRTGPGFSYRVVYRASRGDVMPVTTRGTSGYWFRVVLPDGTFGWILGDQVLPLEVDVTAERPTPSFWSRLGEAIFAPSPLVGSRIGLTFSAGFLGGDGLFLFRPSLVLEPHMTIEAYVGETLGDQIDVLYYGGGANAYLWPGSPFTPFFALGGGGASSRKKADQFVVQTGSFATFNVGGGLLLAFKRRITLRFDFRNHVLFDPNLTRSAQEYSGGLAIFF